MSVPTWKRSASNTEYIRLLYDLSIMIAEMTANGPKKYRASFGDILIKNCLDALKYAQTANSIFMGKTTPPEDILLRRKLLQMSKGTVENISTVSYIYFEQQRKSGYLETEKAYRKEERVAEICNEIINKISAVMKSDKKSR